jgi:hypothetical protein
MLSKKKTTVSKPKVTKVKEEKPKTWFEGLQEKINKV